MCHALLQLNLLAQQTCCLLLRSSLAHDSFDTQSSSAITHDSFTQSNYFALAAHWWQVLEQQV
jgi:hypothetical protein